MVLQVKTSFELSLSTLEETENIIMMITTWFVARQARTTSLFNSHLQDGVNLILILKKIFRFPFYIQWSFSKEAYLTRFAAMLQICCSFLLRVLPWLLACSAGVFFGRANFFSRERAMLKLLSQSSSVIESKMAATTIRTWTSFPPPKIRLHWGYIALGAYSLFTLYRMAFAWARKPHWMGLLFK